MKIIQSQTKLLHPPNLEILRGESPIPLKISRFGNILTIPESGEFEGDCISKIGQIRRDCYLNIDFKKPM